MPQTVRDYRLGGEPVWRIVPDDWEGLMRVPDEVLNSVVFLGRKELDPKTGTEAKVLGGTAFFVAVDVGYGANLVCLVTARHVARDIEHGEFFIRANTRDGKSEDFEIDAGVTARWIYHPTDDSVDVAVMLWAPPPNVTFLSIPENMFLPTKKLNQKRIGIGDEVFVTGLFWFHSGTGVNEPIVRSGHIAMMPKGRIPARDWHAEGIEGHLIEGRSIGGFSGSPVFVRRSIEVQPKPSEISGTAPLAAGAMFWLGLMHGHWNATDEDVDTVRTRRRDPEQTINAGIAIVVPCQKIIEVLHHPDIRAAAAHAVEVLETKHQSLLDGCSPAQVIEGKEREASRRVTLIASTSAPMTKDTSMKRDSAFSKSGKSKGPPPKEEENPDHKEDFMRLLSAAATTKPQADRT